MLHTLSTNNAPVAGSGSTSPHSLNGNEQSFLVSKTEFELLYALKHEYDTKGLPNEIVRASYYFTSMAQPAPEKFADHVNHTKHVRTLEDTWALLSAIQTSLTQINY